MPIILHDEYDYSAVDPVKTTEIVGGGEDLAGIYFKVSGPILEPRGTGGFRVSFKLRVGAYFGPRGSEKCGGSINKAFCEPIQIQVVSVRVKNTGLR
jgi:hypothetical protein